MPAFTCLRRSRHTNAAGDALASGGGSGSDWHDPLYDAAGNMTQGPAPGDETHTHKYIYDAWDRLVEVTDASDVTLASYEYDGLYRRIERREYASGSLSRTLHDYYSDAWQVLEVRQDSETNAHEQYVWGVHYIDAPLCRDWDEDDNGSSLETRVYYLTDANMNVTTLVNPSGTVLERYRYDAYGRAEVLEPNHAADGDGISDYDNAILYAGYHYDADTGLYHVRFRMYHPTLGGWMRRDPIGYVDGLNVYEYVRGRPTYTPDPQGLYIYANDWNPADAFTHWRRGSGEAVYIIGEAFLSAVRQSQGVRAEISNIETQMTLYGKRRAKDLECGQRDTFIIPNYPTTQITHLGGLREYGIGRARITYSTTCEVRRNCNPSNRCSVCFVTACTVTMDGYDKYHSFGKVRNQCGIACYGPLWLWAVQTNGAELLLGRINKFPKAYDIYFTTHEDLRSEECMQ